VFKIYRRLQQSNGRRAVGLRMHLKRRPLRRQPERK
jgi:hypothetical protein